MFQQGTLRWLAVGMAALTIANLLLLSTPVTTLRFRLLYLGYDDNIPAWYSSILLALGAVLALECATAARAIGRRERATFLGLAALLALMSCDEVARLHEQIPVRLSKLLLPRLSNPFPDHGWLLLGGPIALTVLAVAFGALYPVLKTSRASLSRMALGLGLIAFAGVGLELLSTMSEGGAFRLLGIIVEETLEMTGSLLIASSLILWRDSAVPQA